MAMGNYGNIMLASLGFGYGRDSWHHLGGLQNGPIFMLLGSLFSVPY